MMTKWIYEEATYDCDAQWVVEGTGYGVQVQEEPELGFFVFFFDAEAGELHTLGYCTNLEDAKAYCEEVMADP